MTKRAEKLLIERYTRESPTGILSLSMWGVEALTEETKRLRARVARLEKRQRSEPR